jgi:hypothetical protein
MSDSVGPPVLSEHHRHMLEVESAIDPSIIAARGYRSVTADEARRYGFVDGQARAGLIIPVHTTDGKIAGYVLRPDNPRIRIAKRAKKDPRRVIENKTLSSTSGLPARIRGLIARRRVFLTSKIQLSPSGLLKVKRKEMPWPPGSYAPSIFLTACGVGNRNSSAS